MLKKPNQATIISILEKIAPGMGAQLVIEPEWRAVGQVIFKSGRHRYFRFSNLDINSSAASSIARDKGHSTFFMKNMGYPTVPGMTFFSNSWAKAMGSKRTIDAAWNYAEKIGLPVIVKPNGSSQGNGVELVYTKSELHKALRSIFAKEDIALIQKRIFGKDYRVVVLDDTIISAYERIPLHLIGDGRSTIAQLLSKKKRELKTLNRNVHGVFSDPRIVQKLKRDGWKMDSVPAPAARVFLLDNANLSTGGDSVDVRDSIHPDFKEIAVRLTSDMGLRLCGVDLMINGDISEKPNEFYVLEINAAPGLDNYRKSGTEQEKIVEDLYRELLKKMDS